MLFQLVLKTKQTRFYHPPQINGTDIPSGTVLKLSCLYIWCLIPGVAVHLSMSYLRSNQTIYNVAPAIHDVVMNGVGVNGGTLLGVGCILMKAPILPVRE